MNINITYYYHSGFSCEIGDSIFIFDYWTGENSEIPKGKRITSEYLERFRNVYVLISHSHPDHFDPIVYDWYNSGRVNYIVSYEMPVGTRGKRMSPGDIYVIDEKVQIKAFDSTDLGVSYLLQYDGFNIFHAGDLNFWHWREESSAQEIEEAEEAFKTACIPLENEKIDVAFFPVDYRQGRLFDAGAVYFTMTVKPRLLIPMHFWGRPEVPIEFARRMRNNDTEIIAMTELGDQIRLDVADDGFMTINIISGSTSEADQYLQDEGKHDIDPYEKKDPFLDTDLPVRLDE